MAMHTATCNEYLVEKNRVLSVYIGLQWIIKCLTGNCISSKDQLLS